jgi:hypothetical protein
VNVRRVARKREASPLSINKVLAKGSGKREVGAEIRTVEVQVPLANRA